MDTHELKTERIGLDAGIMAARVTATLIGAEKKDEVRAFCRFDGGGADELLLDRNISCS